MVRFRHLCAQKTGALKKLCWNAALGLVFLGSTLSTLLPAQSKTPTGGFLPHLAPNPSSDELLAQDDLWILDLDFKRLRMIPLELIDTETGEKKMQNVWYIVYKFQNKPVVRPGDPTDTTPANTEDEKRIKTIFAPEFELVTHDNDQATTYLDQSLPGAVKAIAKRERLPLEGVVQLTGPLPADADAKPRYGVAIWTNINPKTDFFTIYGNGFTSAYQVNQDDKSVLNRTIELKYARPGDEFEERETEFRELADPKWIYRPAATKQAKATDTAVR